MGEEVKSSNNKIGYSSLRKMKIYIKHGELRHNLVDEEEDLEQPDIINTLINSIMEMRQ